MTRGEAVNWLINIMADMGKAEHRELWHYEQALSEIRDMLESEPERKKGKWLFPYDGTHYKKCSICGAIFYSIWNNMNFCQNCGADMRGDEHEDD